MPLRPEDENLLRLKTRKKMQEASQSFGTPPKPADFEQRTRAMGQAQLDAWTEVFEKTAAPITEDDVRAFKERLEKAQQAGLSSALEELRMRALRTKNSLELHGWSGRLTRTHAQVFGALCRDVDIWVAEMKLKHRPALPWWLVDPEGEQDHLTKLPLRKAFDRDIASAIADASPQKPVAFLYIDADFFKKINDSHHGHDGGDRALIEISAVIRTTVDRRGKAYRWGGEEMIVLLPNADASEAQASAERIRMAIKAKRIFEDRDVTVSIGVAIATSPTCTAADLTKRADDALRSAKALGRDRVEMELSIPSDRAGSGADETPTGAGPTG